MAVLFAFIRKKFTSKIDRTLKSTDGSNALSHLELAVVDVALSQGNYDVAARYLCQTKNKVLCDYCNTRSFSHAYYYREIVYIDQLPLFALSTLVCVSLICWVIQHTSLLPNPAAIIIDP
jgi:hypothetical protein